MAENGPDLYKLLIENLGSLRLSSKELSEPDPTLESEIVKIYTQTREHRNRLVWFYILYTIGFTLFVLLLIGWQGYERVRRNDATFEILPRWSLNILVTGMFVQFIGLLKIVTQRVWDFKELFAHHYHLKTGTLEAEARLDPDKTE